MVKVLETWTFKVNGETCFGKRLELDHSLVSDVPGEMEAAQAEVDAVVKAIQAKNWAGNTLIRVFLTDERYEGVTVGSGHVVTAPRPAFKALRKPTPTSIIVLYPPDNGRKPAERLTRKTEGREAFDVQIAIQGRNALMVASNAKTTRKERDLAVPDTGSSHKNAFTALATALDKLHVQHIGTLSVTCSDTNVTRILRGEMNSKAHAETVAVLRAKLSELNAQVKDR